MISICVTVKNRSRVHTDGRELRLFPNCVRSIVESVQRVPGAELVISDWSSDDWPLRDWLPQAIGDALPTRIINTEGDFSRGRGRNVAAQFSSGDALLFLDADSILCEAVLTRGLELLSEAKSFFPILYSFRNPEHTDGWWRRFGFGNCVVSREVFEKSGGWPEFTQWGKEDDLFYARVCALTPVVREEVPGFFHQWHPEDVEWKDSHAPKSQSASEAQSEREQLALAKREVAELLPANARAILVDEDQWRHDFMAGRSFIPFTERDGQYWGPPADDASALAELERLRRAGAEFMVFGWPAFWWFHHYLGLQRRLEENFRKVLHNERLIIFDLREPL
jgi:glycosyltransferase involved in cell wall biosynthesis